MRGRGGFLNTLSGRFLLLTVAFVMLAEVMIFVPSIARYRADFLLMRLKEAQIVRADLIVGVDSGPLHAARCRGTRERKKIGCTSPVAKFI